jgi:hypothetical protein
MIQRRWSRAVAAVLAAAAGAVILAAAGCEESAPSAPAAVPSPAPLAAAPSPTPSPAATTQPPAPTPAPTAEACPPLTSWSSTIHNITNAGHQPVDKPRAGGYVVVDSTPLFNGRPCNAEHDHCGGRKCEDPRGGVWWLLEGESPTEERGDGYQFRIGPLREGQHRWKVCPRSDAQDAQGQPVLVGWGSCTQGSFTVQP